jgi:hypothetical protein
MFTARVRIAVTLRNAKRQHDVVGVRVKTCTLELLPHGFAGRVTFWNDLGNSDDELFPWFLDPELMEVELTIELADAEPKDVEASRIVLHGLVSDRALGEGTVVGVGGEPVATREYTVAFVDAAALLWRQHQPLELRADANVKQVIEAHLAGHIKLDCSLGDADQTLPMVCVPTGVGDASFYDFVMWYADRAAGCWQYDYWAKGYRLAAKRATHAATQKLQRKEVASLRVSLPAHLRHSARVLNAHSAAAQTASVELPHAVAGIARDRLMRSPTHADIDACKQVEQDRWRQPHPELEVELKCYPTVPLMPGAQAALREEQFSGKIHPAGKSFRVAALSLAAEAADSQAYNRGDGVARAYQMTLRVTCESDADERGRLPRHQSPTWPVFVEGTIVSDIGDAIDRTFMTSDDKQTSLSHYVVYVPLWNQNIKVPFGPQFLPGHFFAPAFKSSRVLLALYFEHAEITQFLDWGPDVRLPNESQGNHLLFGKNAKSQTSLKHAYINDKPVLSLTRMNAADEGRLQLEEGTLVLEIKEDPRALAATETHDLTAQVLASQAKLESGAQESIGKIQAAGDKGKGVLDGKLSAARSRLSGALEGLGGEMGAKVAAGKSELQQGPGEVDGRVAEMQAKSEAAKAELQSKRGGG